MVQTLDRRAGELSACQVQTTLADVSETSLCTEGVVLWLVVVRV